MIWNIICLFAAARMPLAIASASAWVDPLRPMSHFLPTSNWMNDPNAPWYDSETGMYHLMYQYLTPRVWGHAVSYNMVDWEILETALNYTDEWYTQVPGEIPGVYSGSATRMQGGQELRTQVWLAASTPTNDMMILAYPSNLSDPKLKNWTWDENNPTIYADSNPANADVPPGRDPTEFWPCGLEGSDQWCVGYATQLSEGCPCSGVSGFAIFSSTFDSSVSMSSSSWGAWEFEGYMLNDTAEAVMWECVDFFPLNITSTDPFESSIWVVKYSIGPGPSYTLPYGNPGPRDYYVTGVYNPTDPAGFDVNKELWDLAMLRDTAVALDVGAFYASKSFLDPIHGRVLWGWLPEERPVDADGSPWGWAGVMSLPRQIISYRNGSAGAWLVKTPPLDSVLQDLRQSASTHSAIALSGAEYAELTGVAGQQLEFLITMDSSTIGVRGDCGVRVFSSLQSSPNNPEYTDVGVRFGTSGIGDNVQVTDLSLYVDPSMSCSDGSMQVNRTILSTAPLAVEYLSEGVVEFHVIIDHSVVEAFLEDGLRAITRRVYPANPTKSVGVQLYSNCHDGDSCGQCTFSSVSSWVLRDAEISLASSEDSSTSRGNDDSSGLDSWEIALIVIIPLVFLVFAAGVIYFYFFRSKDSEKKVLVQSRI